MGSEKQDSVVLHLEDFEDIEGMKDADAGKLLKAILCYVSTGALPEKLGVQAKTMFGYIRRHIDRDKSYYDEVKKKRSEAGKKGGRPKKANESKKSKRLFSESKKSYPDTDTDTDPDTDPDTDTDPETVAQRSAPGNGFSSGLGADTEGRIQFLKSMIRLFEAGALTDREDYEMYQAELRELEGRA